MITIKKVAIAAGAFIVAAGAAGVMVSRHLDTSVEPAPVQAQIVASPQFSDTQIADAILRAGLEIRKLQVRIAGDIVILRGHADPASAARAVEVTRSLGAKRIANLITAEAVTDDDALRREAERVLAHTGSLEGCALSVESDAGVLTIGGRVQRSEQIEVAQQALRRLRGVRDVKVDITTSRG